MRIVVWTFLALLTLPAQAQNRASDPTAELDRATEWLRQSNRSDALSTERSMVLESGANSGTAALERHGDKIDQDRRDAEAQERAREAAREEALRTHRAR
jgi:hypothetical protein